MIKTPASQDRKMLVAHLGAHKTATSLVQKYFKEKKKYYIQQGVFFLERGEVSPFISWGDKVVENPSAFAKGIAAKTKRSDCQTILFSNENALGKPFRPKPGLYPHSLKIMPAFREALKDYHPRIVYTIRPQWEFLESYYLQLVHQGYFLTFNQFLDTVDLEKLQWTPLVEGLQAEFGKENVSVMDFGLIRKGQDKFLSEFVKRNLPDGIVPDLNYDEVHNASISDRGLQMALRVNPLLKQGVGETKLVRHFLQTHFSNRTEPRPILLSEQLRQTLKDRYEAEYNALIGAG